MQREFKRIIIEMSPLEYKKIKSAGVWFEMTLRELFLKGIEAIGDLDELKKEQTKEQTNEKYL